MFHKSFTGGDALALLERALRGRDDAFYVLLESAASNAAQAAALLKRLLEVYPDDADALAEDVHSLEYAGDRITREIVNRLNREVATPIDREDILLLSEALDDITDFIHASAASLTLYRTEAPMVQADALASVLLDATRELVAATHQGLRGESVTPHTVEVHRLENEGDHLVRRAIASLFVDGIDPLVVLRWKEIFERIEDAIDATETAAFVLESIVIKNI